MRSIVQIIAVSATYFLLDGLWLGLLMTKTYERGLAPLIRRSADGSLAPAWGSAIVVYALLVLAVIGFVRPLSKDLDVVFTAGIGAILGVVIYGVYDFTNHATLKDWPLWLAVIDVLWGGFIVGSAAAVMKLSERFVS